jgi:predicted outer membrane repeat protein
MVNDTLRNTVRLLEGTYGPSTNNEMMPVVLPSYYNISGVSANEVIIDAEGQSGAIIIDHGEGITISDLTITGGNAEYGGGISSNGNVTIQNVIIRNNIANAGGGMDFGGFLGGSNAILHNVLLTENVAYSRGGAIYSSRATLTFQNVTVSNNQSARGKGIFCSNGSEIILRNSIFSENTDAIHFLGYNAENYVTSSWSDVHGPIVTNSNGSFIWGEGSINEDPLFEGIGDHPYALSLGSPCIDAGNPDTTGLSLPQWDVIGNQRIWDGDGNGTEIIDMGA